MTATLKTMPADAYMNRKPYTYFLSAALRPARLSKRVDTRIFTIDPDADFFWQAVMVSSEYWFFIKSIQTPLGPLFKEPIHSYNFGSATLPFYLVNEMRLRKSSRVVIEFYNTISPSRRWNHIEMAFSGEKEFE